MLSGLSLQNFKAFGKEINLNIKPLTILVGENGSGKSGILEAICLMSQNTRALSDPLLLNGEFLNFPSYEIIFHKLSTTLPMKLSVNILPNETERQTIRRSLIDANLCSLAADYDSHREIGYEYVYSFPKDTEKKNYTAKQTLTVANKKLAETSREFVEGQFIQRIQIPLYQRQIQPNRGTMGFFLSPLPFQIADSGSDTFNRLTEVLIGCFRTRLQNKVRILYSTRGIFPYSIPSYEEGNDWVGTHGEYVLYILSKIFADPTKKELKDYIIKWASKFGLDNLTAGFASEGKSAGKLMSFFFDSASKEYINTAYAGFGSRQALVLLVQLLWSAKNDMILIEEPEMSLHPAAQVYLPQLFAEIINQQKNIILTTHSEFFILALSNPIQRKLIRPSDVAVYNLQKGPEGTKVKSLEIGENGYIKEWIPSFTKVETELMQEFLKTVPET